MILVKVFVTIMFDQSLNKQFIEINTEDIELENTFELSQTSVDILKCKDNKF